jgi:DNA polymerase I-like protein with 3'-5' exonuclease and polymerase domains
MLFPTLKDFYEQYQMPLAHALYHVERRGLMVDQQRLKALASDVATETAKQVEVIKQATGLDVVVYKKDAKDEKTVVLNAPQDVIRLFKDCKLTVPKNRQTGRETTNETALQRLASESGHPVPRAVLSIRELTKIKGTYIDAELHNSILYCTYVAIGTVGGRRSSRANFLGLGTNHQNLPKYSDLAKRYRKCIIARPGKIFVACDQKGAEDWIVCAIIVDNGGSSRGLDELRSGINRHRKLAAFLFARPEDQCTKDHPTGAILYYLAKKTRHGGNYDMYGNKMSEELAKEGQFFPGFYCQALLEKFHEFDPDIRAVFHKYVQNEMKTKRELRTPIGRRRTFLALRPFSDNSSIFRDGYSYIPQSTVGDNNGLSILYCERNAPGLVVADGHDATYTEVNDNVQSVERTTEMLLAAYNRKLVFPNGTEIEIPCEFEMGYNLKDLVTYEPDRIREAYDRAQTGKTVDTVVH